MDKRDTNEKESKPLRPKNKPNRRRDSPIKQLDGKTFFEYGKAKKA